MARGTSVGTDVLYPGSDRNTHEPVTGELVAEGRAQGVRRSCGVRAGDDGEREVEHGSNGSEGGDRRRQRGRQG